MPGARSDTTPKAIRPNARVTARFLSSIAAILRDRQPALRMRRYSPAWSIRTGAGEEPFRSAPRSGGLGNRAGHSIVRRAV
jgi:hypothetical protein